MTKKKLKKKTIKIVYNLLIVFFSLVFIGCAVYLVNYFYASHKSESKYSDLRELISDEEDKPVRKKGTTESKNPDDEQKETEYVDINGVKVQKRFEKIYKKNSDFVGWLKISGTVIDYPVMQTPDDEEYYIDKDFDKEYSAAGTLFVDAYSDLTSHNDNTIIYGHNMKTGKMFHCLLEYENESYYKKHKYLQFDTIYGDATYEVIAAFRTKIYPVDYEGFKYYKFYYAENELEFDNYVNSCKSLTSYPIETHAKYGDELLTLSTCAYHDENGRFVVVAKKIDQVETTTKSSNEGSEDKEK